MNWILEHIQVLIAGAAAIAWWLNQRRESRQEERAEKDARTRPPATADEGEEAERTRRIQEDIRRRIAERRAQAEGVPRPELPLPPPLPSERPRPLGVPDVAPSPRREPTVRKPVPVDDGMLERQRRMAEQLRELNERRRETSAAAAALRQFPTATAPGAALPATRAFRHRGELLADLRDPQSARRAIVLREVLGPPKALS